VEDYQQVKMVVWAIGIGILVSATTGLSVTDLTWWVIVGTLDYIAYKYITKEY